MPVILEKAVDVVESLNEWIATREGLSTIPIAWLSWHRTSSGYESVDISIGEIVVFQSEVEDDNDLTFEYCRERFQDYIGDLQPFIPTIAAGE